MSELGTIKQELAACCAAFVGSKVGDLAWCVHHDWLCESLKEPVEARIRFILADKPKAQQARRFREFRPVLGKVPVEWDAAEAEWAAAYAKWDAARAKWAAASAEWDAAEAEWAAAYAKWAAARAKWAAASAKWAAADAEWAAARAKWDAARAKWAAAYARHLPAFAALHTAECPDSAWDGQTIFPSRARGEDATQAR